MSRFFSVFFFLTLFLAGPGHAQFGMEEAFGLAGKKDADSSVASLISENKTIAPGTPFTVGLKIDLPEGWHSYYLNSGGLELPLSINWSLPDGYSAGPIQWPTPEVIEGYDAKSFAYSGSPVFLVDIIPPPQAEVGSKAIIKADAKWQICRTGACMDESESLSLTLPVAAMAEPDEAQTDQFRAARAAIPQRGESWTATFEKSGGDLKLRVNPPSGLSLPDEPNWEFIPSRPFASSLSDGGTAAREGGGWVLTVKSIESDILGNAIEIEKTLPGILTADAPLDATGTRAILIEASQEAGHATPPPTVQLSFIRLLILAGLMFLGGLVLNLMPCVFPVIGLKIMGFVQQSGDDSRKVIQHGLAFTTGVLVSFWVLSGILFVARAAAFAKTGTADGIGWGYQLQNPWIVLSITVLLLVLALNMFGVFEIGTSATSIGGSLQSRQGISGAFFSGLLATLVATPCAGPFLGWALGAAVQLPGGQFFMAFTAMALGLALPYLLLSLFPRLVNYLPRPGAWMESFKQGMSFLLFASAGYFLWVYTKQIGVESMLRPVFGLTAIAIAAWIYGRWNLPHRPRRTRLISSVLALGFSLGGLWISSPPQESGLTWEPWSAERVASLNAEGTPVFVDFTATWCATCQFNKARAYPPEVVDVLKKRGVVTLKADKTNPDPAIEAELQKLGRTAIPVNALYLPGKDPIITPEILSANYVKSLIEEEVPLPD